MYIIYIGHLLLGQYETEEKLMMRCFPYPVCRTFMFKSKKRKQVRKTVTLKEKGTKAVRASVNQTGGMQDNDQ